jgi:hypothetical protein
MLKSAFFIGILSLSFCCTAQTAPEKVAAAFCKCTENNEEYASAVKLLRTGDMELIKQRFEEVETQFYTSKRCAKSNTVLTKEEERKIDEDEIQAALIENCPDEAFLYDEYRRISGIIEKEQKQSDLLARHTKIEQHIAKKEIDSVQYELLSYINMYHLVSDNGPRIVDYYYQIGYFETGNAIAIELIEIAQNYDIPYDDRPDKTIPVNEFVLNELETLATKYKQQLVLDALK